VETLKKIKNVLSLILIYAFITLLYIIGIPGSIITMGMITEGLFGHFEVGVYLQGLIVAVMVAAMILSARDRMAKGEGFWKALFTPDPNSDYDPYDWDRINLEAYY